MPTQSNQLIVHDLSREGSLVFAAAFHLLEIHLNLLEYFIVTQTFPTLNELCKYGSIWILQEEKESFSESACTHT